MRALSLDVINASAPYEVYWHEASHTYRFRSDYDVVLAIGFDDDDIIETAESYVFSIIILTNACEYRGHGRYGKLRCVDRSKG